MNPKIRKQKYLPFDSGRVAIRAARTADSPDLLRLIRAYYRFDHIRFDPHAISRALGELLRRPSLGRTWIICHNARPVGYVLLTFNFDLEFGGTEGLVTDLYVDSAYRGGGFGRRALDVVDNYCRARGIGTVELQVENDNAAALAFYKRIGFKQLSRVVMTRKVRRNSHPIGRRQPSASP
jgi:ribosomal protein S18 acetylase RimI-like enzyme